MTNKTNPDINAALLRPVPVKKKKSDMAVRIAITFAMVALLAGILKWGDVPLLLLAGLVAGIGIREFFHVARVPGFTAMGVISTSILIGVSFAGFHWPGSVPMPAGFLTGLGTIALVVGLLGMLLLQLAARRPHFTLSDLGIMVFGIFYIGGILSLAFPLMGMIRDAYPAQMPMSRIGLLLPIWAASGSDSFAYFVGSLFGRRPFFPDLSPRKTWEGLIGGFVIAVGGMVALGLHMGFPLHHALVLGILSCAAAPLGDLAESAIKREFTVKDAGTILGPMGGVMDRIDSLLFTLPVVYFYLLLAKPFPGN